jgi:hypothetical protein
MNQISAISSENCVEDISKILEFAQQKKLDFAEKLLKLKLEQSVGAEIGKGNYIDISA